MAIKERNLSLSGTNKMLRGLVSLFIDDAGKNYRPKRAKMSSIAGAASLSRFYLGMWLRESRMP